MPLRRRSRDSTGRRLMWFAAIWIGSVATLGVVAYGIRLMIP